MKPVIKFLPLSFRNKFRSPWHRSKLAVATIITKISRQFYRPPFPKAAPQEINLHLGCGIVNQPEFINIDGLPAPHIHYVRGIDNLSIFEDGVVDFIYACHCLEHLPFSKIPAVLTEWFRVLKTGGRLRLSVPDFDLLLKIYSDTGNDISCIEGFLLGVQDYKYNFHYAVFNKLHLVKQLENVGFAKIYEWHSGIDEPIVENDCSSYTVQINEKEYSVSLNLEAEK